MLSTVRATKNCLIFVILFSCIPDGIFLKVIDKVSTQKTKTKNENKRTTKFNFCFIILLYIVFKLFGLPNPDTCY